jgi:hypothetical protein
VSKPRLRLHVENLVAGIPNKYQWWYITLPDGRKTTRCRTPGEVFKHSVRLREYLKSLETTNGTEASRDDQPGQLPEQG